jgi:hypothetical protein
MTVRYRPMRREDIPECVEIVAANPIVGPRYRDAIKNLARAWQDLLGADAFRSVVFEDIEGRRVTLLGSGTSAFVTDEFLHDFKVPPFFWIGPELARRVTRGEQPLLSDRQMRTANADGGLNLVTWEGCMRPEHIDRPDLANCVVSSYVEQHTGYLLKEWITQTPTLQAFRVCLQAGGVCLNPADGRYSRTPPESPEELFAKPHGIGLTRELAATVLGSWVGSVFIYRRPQLQLRPSQQRLLRAAMAGATDSELSVELGLALSTIKKTWSAIYGRAEMTVPSLISDEQSEGLSEGVRGKQKKQRLLAYLRDHPEELRPSLR